MKLNKSVILILLASVYAINSLAQDLAKIDSVFHSIQEHDRECLRTYRSCENRLKAIDYDMYSSYKNCSIENFDTPIIQGRDLSRKAVYSDTLMQSRILQLLKGEFYEGELEELVAKELEREEYSTWTDSAKREESIRLEKKFQNQPSGWEMRKLLEACQYINNKQIIKRIEEMYKDPLYKYCKLELLDCLLIRHVEPYTSQVLRKSIYNKAQNDSIQLSNISQLYMIYNQKAFREMAEYLLSDAYQIMYLCDDNHSDNDVHNVNDEHSVNDTIIFTDESGNRDTIITDGYLDLEFEEDDTPSVEEYRYYCFVEAFSCIQFCITNDDLQSMLKKMKGQVSSVRFISKENRRKIYNWMQRNYGKYKIKNRWY